MRRPSAFLVFACILFFAAPVYAQYVRDDCSTVTPATTFKGTCYDYNGGVFKYWDGAAWQSISSGGGGGSIDGSGVAGRVALWSDSDTLTSQSGITFSGNTLTATTFIGALTGNASTATALAANGSNCSSGNAPLGVDASGAAENCTDYMEEPSGNGIVARTAANTSANRTITGTSNRVGITNGDGVSGNPTLTVPDSAQLNVAKLVNLTSNGFIKTGSGDGTLSVDTTTYCQQGGTNCPSGLVPGGSDTQFQYNNGGSLAGSALLSYDAAHDALLIQSATPYEAIRMTSSGGPQAYIYPYPDGSIELDAGDGSNAYLLIGGGSVEANAFSVSKNYSAVSGTPGLDLTATYIPASGTPSDTTSVINTTTTYGYQGVAAIGTLQHFVSGVIVEGNGNSDNEYAPHLNFLRVDLGTGYTQNTGPIGRAWLADWGMHGPIGVQPDTLNGLVLFANNYYNGSPADSPSGGIWLTTQRDAGPAKDATHGAADTYPMDVGLGITGVSNAGSDAIGWTTAIQVGGSGSPWNESASKIGTGIDISQIVTRGIYIHDVIGTPTAAIEATAGAIIFGDLKTTGAATGKTVVCVDTSTGRLYASSSGVACAN